MKVILLKNIDTLGRRGDVKNVSDGYGRNFLIPQKMATLATATALSKTEEEKKLAIEQAERELAQAQEMAAKLDGLEFEILAKASEDGKLFGSINAAKIVEVLKFQGYNVAKENVKLAEPIKEVGEYDIVLEMSDGLEAKIKLIIIEESK